MSETVLLATVAALAIGVNLRRWRGTTLAACWLWQGLATVAVLGVEGMLASADIATPAWSEAGRYLAAICTWAPGMAVLGAKRPQHRAWQLIVLTLLVVLALPGLEVLVLRPGAVIALHVARSAFLLVLWTIGWVNYLPTRQAMASLLWGVGQLVLLAPYVPWLEGAGLEAWRAWGPALLVAGVVVSASVNVLSRRNMRGWPRVWLDFRDGYGVVWTVRVAERFNLAARRQQLPVQLAWRGMVVATNKTAPIDSSTLDSSGLDPTAVRPLRALLLRFVASAWIVARTQQTVD